MTRIRDPDEPSTRLLFVCLGNICRSPLAEGVFAHLAESAGQGDRYRVDSAGTGAWHVGEPPDPRSIEVAHAHGIQLRGSARQVRPEDFHMFDRILAMDRQNLQNLERLREKAGGKAALSLLREFDPEAHEDLDVPDPYYGGPAGFDEAFTMVRRACAGLLEAMDSEDTQPG